MLTTETKPLAVLDPRMAEAEYASVIIGRESQPIRVNTRRACEILSDPRGPFIHGIFTCRASQSC
ncbi:MAG: hypothetical protein AAFR17_19815 [Pseudomonadota bacterium]